MQPLNILFTSAGRRHSLIADFKRTLQDLEISGNTVTADMSRLSAASFAADHREQIVAVRSKEYIDQLLLLCRKHAVRLVIPLIDTELPVLSANKARFLAEGITVMVSSPETIAICTDKRTTAAFFTQAGFKTPKIHDPLTILHDPAAQYPFFLKPANGSSSIGAMRIENAKELAFFIEYIEDCVVQDCIVGEEYTLDVLVDFAGNVEVVVPRLRIETRAGEVSKGMTVKNTALMEAGRKVVAALPGAVGCITVQCFLTSNNSVIFTEINPRFGGGYPLSFQAGANFPQWIIQKMQGLTPDDITHWQDGLVMLRYDDAVFINRAEVYP